MKVAIVTSFPRDASRPQGGVEAVSVNLVKALSEFDDLDIHVVTFDSQASSIQTDVMKGSQVHRLPTPRGSVLLNALFSGRRAISNYVRALQPDLVHSHDTYGLMVKGLAIPRVFTVHGFIYADTLESGLKLPKLRSRIWKWVETSGWADHPHIISISPYVRERISGWVSGKIHDIENPISESFFNVSRHETPLVVFSAAVISSRKNTLAIVDACKILVDIGVDVKLRLAGKIVEPGYGETVKNRIIRHGLSSRVAFLGSLNTDQVRDELSRAAVFSLVSLEENAPLGIEEAMAVGVPVVASNRCGMPYMVRNGETGFLVDPTSPEDIAGRLFSLLRDENQRKAMGRNALTTALERYHPSRVALRTREVYDEALKGSAV